MSSVAIILEKKTFLSIKETIRNNFYLSTDNTDFLLVNNYQKLFNNFICTQIKQITQILVSPKLPKIIQQFYLYTDYTDNTDFLLVNNYQKLSNNFICTQITQITQIFCWSKIIKNYPTILFVHRLHR